MAVRDSRLYAMLTLNVRKLVFYCFVLSFVQWFYLAPEKGRDTGNGVYSA